MKKFLAMMLVLLLALGCTVGCGGKLKDQEANKTNAPEAKALTVSDVTEAMNKLSAGCELEYSFLINLKPVYPTDDNGATKEMYEAIFGSFADIKSDGSFDFSLKFKGEGTEKGGKINILLKDTPVTDLVFHEDHVYLNLKSIFNMYLEIIKASGDPETAGYTEFLKWPYENEYVDLSKLAELDMMPDFSAGGDDFAFTALEDDISGDDPLGDDGILSQLEPAEIAALVSALQKSVTSAQMTVFMSRLEETAIKAQILTSDERKIEVRIDKTNAKGFVVEFSKFLKENLADFVAPVVESLKTAEELPDSVKAMLDTFDKAEFQKQLDEEFTDENVKTNSEDFEKEMGDSSITFLMEVADSSVNVKFDLQLTKDVLISGEDDSIESFGFTADMKCTEKQVAEIAVPENVLTEEELQNLLSMFMFPGMGGDIGGDLAV